MFTPTEGQAILAELRELTELLRGQQQLAVKLPRLAELMDVSPDTIRRHAADLPVIQLGGCDVYPVHLCRKWLEERSRSAA